MDMMFLLFGIVRSKEKVRSGDGTLGLPGSKKIKRPNGNPAAHLFEKTFTREKPKN